MEINTAVIALPDFDECVLDRIAVGIQKPSTQVGDLADRRRKAVVDDDQIVIGIERQMIRIKRAFRLPRGADQFFGEQSIATIGSEVEVKHGKCLPRVPARSF
jgi:hypothetical protein